jgi:carboxymethylenebutenolidase
MVDRPTVNHVPVMTGGVGRKQLTHFYDRYFIPQMPPDTQIIPVSRTMGHHRLVDEFVIKHSQMASELCSCSARLHQRFMLWAT